MDPVSQTQASETLAARGYSVIGWYHSHPAFDPNPSIRDIDTQAKYQVNAALYVTKQEMAKPNPNNPEASVVFTVLMHIITGMHLKIIHKLR